MAYREQVGSKRHDKPTLGLSSKRYVFTRLTKNFVIISSDHRVTSHCAANGTLEQLLNFVMDCFFKLLG